MNNSQTHGGRTRSFEWKVIGNLLVITNEFEKEHKYSLEEILAVIRGIESQFGMDWFPLADNVEKLYRGEEKPGLGNILYALKPDTYYAQGSSYLGVVLENLGILEWNSAKWGIKWKLKRKILNEEIKAILIDESS